MVLINHVKETKKQVKVGIGIIMLKYKENVFIPSNFPCLPSSQTFVLKKILCTAHTEMGGEHRKMNGLA